MATLSKYGDPRCDPESAKRLASGVWKREYSALSNTETWICNKRKLNDKLAEAMLDRDFADQLHKHGHEILDRICGQGTADAFRYKSGERVAMRFDPPIRDKMMGAIQGQRNQILGCDLAGGRDQMALGYSTYTGATSGNTFTTATTGSTTSDNTYWIRDEVRAQLEQSVKHATNRVAAKRQPMKPFRVETGGTLLSSLQREFDRWAGPQLKLVSG